LRKARPAGRAKGARVMGKQQLLRAAKPLLLLLAFLVALPAAAQPSGIAIERDESGIYSYQRVTETDGTAEDLYARAIAWVKESYESAPTLDDKKAGRIVVTGAWEDTYLFMPAYYNHTLTIEVKDGRYRATFSHFILVLKDAPEDAVPFEEDGYFPNFRRVKEKTAEHISAMLASLSTYMGTRSEDEDW
jgi:hypothetical protein